MFECLKDEEGRIYLNPDGFAIRKLDHIPHPVVSVIPEWKMEAMSRLNPDIGDLDFSDRMAPVIKLRLILTGVQNERQRGKTIKKNRQFKQMNGRPSRWLSTSVVLEIDKCNVSCCGRKQSLTRQLYTTE